LRPPQQWHVFERQKPYYGFMRTIMEQPVPIVSETDVERIVHRDFGHDQVPGVLAVLESVDLSPRTCLSILKIARGDLIRLQEAARVAVQDCRDVLTAAEYPRYGAEIGFDDVSEVVVEQVIKSDWEQYQDWLQRP
jgi:hypothetical protein